ncbi:hypothetical protein HN011_002508 [Eciton burchellii]|nr:hypothetical protein HN011_002508 [Eciton burchellii]
MNSLVEEVVVEAGKTVTLGCPGVTEDSLVLMLEWRANGMRLLEYKSSSTTVVRHFRDRMSLSLKNYSLHLHPVTAADSGTYECVVNNRNALDAVIKLVVRESMKVRESVDLGSNNDRLARSRGRDETFTTRPMSWPMRVAGESTIRLVPRRAFIGDAPTMNIAASRFSNLL